MIYYKFNGEVISSLEGVTQEELVLLKKRQLRVTQERLFVVV
jgi:hypothetical protein